MSVTRVGANKRYSDNWENIFGGSNGRSTAKKRTVTAARKSAKKKSVTTKARKAAKKRSARK